MQSIGLYYLKYKKDKTQESSSICWRKLQGEEKKTNQVVGVKIWDNQQKKNRPHPLTIETEIRKA